MLRHYIKVALRLIRRSLLFSSINLMGFVLGLTAAFLIYLWVVDELTHADCFRDGNRIYRVTELRREAGGEIKESPRLPRTLAMDFRQKFPQVEDATAIKYGDRHSYEAEDGKKMAVTETYVDSTFFRVVPNNSLGKSAVRWLRSNDVHCTPMILTEPDETPSNRLGTYYLETGYGIRASKVIYDRKHSAITEYDFSQVDLDALLDGFDWLHLSGITPALAPNCRTLILDMLKVAKKKGLTVSFDGNFRSTLWTWEEARDFCTECLPYVDVLLGIEPYHLWKDENDHSKGDWKDGVPLQPSYEQQDEIFQHFIERYPNLKCIARHVRYAHSGSENSLKAFMWYDGHTFESKLFTFNILDRVGGGDAFASGLIYAMLHNYRAMDMINFAVASSAIKHTIHGDANITDDVSSIRNLMNMNYDIKR